MKKIRGDAFSPLVRKTASSILWLRNHGPHGLLKRQIQYLDTDPGIEGWALSSFLFSVLAFVLSGLTNWLSSVLCIIGVLRLFEILVNAIHVTLFHGYLDRKPLAGHRRIVLLLLINYLEVVFWFSFAYRVLETAFTEYPGWFPMAALTFSLSTASGFGDVVMQHDSTWITGLSFVESLIGLFMAIAVLARFISLLPPPPQSPIQGLRRR